VMACFAAVYLGLAGWLVWRVQRMLATRPPFLQATLAEMARDRAALQAASGPAPVSGKDHHE
ncbi:MAG: phage holin family protein, partial [Polaromonas sp.]|nr:phage holin family protein [Polaromonas sp.]